MTRQILWRGAHFWGVEGFSAGFVGSYTNQPLWIKWRTFSSCWVFRRRRRRAGRPVDRQPRVCRNAARGAEVVTTESRQKVRLYLFIVSKCELKILSFLLCGLWCDWGGRGTSGCDYTDAADHVMICWCSFFFLFFCASYFLNVILDRLHGRERKKQTKKTILLHLAKMK